MKNFSNKNLVWLKKGIQKRVFANVKIGTDVNCDKEHIPTAKIDVFRTYLGFKKDAENMTSEPETNVYLPSRKFNRVILTRTLQIRLRKPHFTIEINFTTTKIEHYKCFHRSQLHLLGLFELLCNVCTPFHFQFQRN